LRGGLPAFGGFDFQLGFALPSRFPTFSGIFAGIFFGEAEILREVVDVHISIFGEFEMVSFMVFFD
jgi:hypothetical protein